MQTLKPPSPTRSIDRIAAVDAQAVTLLRRNSPTLMPWAWSSSSFVVLVVQPGWSSRTATHCY